MKSFHCAKVSLEWKRVLQIINIFFTQRMDGSEGLYIMRKQPFWNLYFKECNNVGEDGEYLNEVPVPESLHLPKLQLHLHLATVRGISELELKLLYRAPHQPNKFYLIS